MPEQPEPRLPDPTDPGLTHAIIAIDAARRIVAFNAVAQSWFGRAASEMLDAPLEELPGPLIEALNETLSRGEAIPERLIHIPNGPDSILNLRLSTVAMRGLGGGYVGAIAVLNDLDRAGGFDRKLRQVDRLASLGTLAAGIAHEIKNALVAVRSFVDLLISKSPETKFTEVVSREIRRIDTLVSQMLRFSAPDRGTYSPISVHEVIGQSLQLVQRELPERQITLQCSLEARADQIQGDPSQLEQAFLNIVFNALDAMGTNGQLRIASSVVAPEGGEKAQASLIEISIADTGAGIPEEIHDRLFEPFFTTKANGSGLGLTITRQIIEEHGGTIRVESEPAHGTTFYLRLPLAPPPA